MTRRRLIESTAVAAVALAVGKETAMAQTTTGTQLPPSPSERLPRFPDELVHEFVGVAHRDLARVEEMLKEHPKLVNAVWDWGGGDFESALGAAGHMGRADIARLLLAHGARFDLFAAAMLGELEAVKVILTASPELLKVPGPHGIPLIAHAKAGGERAAAVLQYLQTLG